MTLFLKTMLKHFIIFSLLVLVMVCIIFVLGQFNSLHPDAYRDGVMSIVYVYAIILFLHLLIYIIKSKTRFDALKLPSQWLRWHQNSGVFLHIALGFTFITVINNIMMVTGIDVPKTGTFAYTHLLIRTLIVTVAVIIWMYKDVYYGIKSVFKLSKKPMIHTVAKAWKAHGVLASTAMMFTTITVIGCLFMVIFSGLLNPQGGFNLYLSLIILFVVLLGVNVFLKIVFSTKTV